MDPETGSIYANGSVDYEGKRSKCVLGTEHLFAVATAPGGDNCLRVRVVIRQISTRSPFLPISEYTFKVLAMDSPSSLTALSSSVRVTVTIADANDNPPKFRYVGQESLLCTYCI